MKETIWSKWASISEIFSSLAIVVTLAFLAVQTNQNTDAINAQIVANKADSRAAIWEMLFKTIDQAVVSPRININLASTETLSAIEEAELYSWLLGFWGTREFVWIQYQDGVVDQLT